MEKYKPQPEPVMDASYLAGLLITLVMSGVAMLSGLGIVQWDTTEQSLINAFFTAVINVLIVVITMWYKARPKVTPLENPRDDTGAPLVRADGGDPVVKA